MDATKHRLRRFSCAQLTAVKPDQIVSLPESECRHIRVLRLPAGARVELADDTGTIALAELLGDSEARVLEIQNSKREFAHKLTVAVAWPKGKRAAFMIEKCSELGADALIPIRYSRSVVHKEEDSESVARLRRIAAESAKQCGRARPLEIFSERSFVEMIGGKDAHTFNLVLNPRAELTIENALEKDSFRNLCIYIGPEGGITEEELALAASAGIVGARMAAHMLRIETAAIAACAVCRSVLESRRASEEIPGVPRLPESGE